MNLTNIFTVIRFVWLELTRARLWWLALALVGSGSAIAEFTAAIAVTESAQHRLVFYAASMRIAAVFVMALLVATSILREIDDKVVELALSRPLSRSEWYIGKLLGYITTSMAFSLVIASPLIFQVPVPGLIWCFSLLLELTIVVAAALAFAITLKQSPLALSVVAGFYILARGIAGMALISRGPTVDLSSASNQFIARLVDVLAHVLPDLHRFTDSAWLLGMPPSAADLGVLTIQTLVYTTLLAAVGLFDLHRRNF